MSDIDDKPIKTIQDAEQIYKYYGCSRYHMWHDNTVRYNEYENLEISKELEVKWSTDVYYECRVKILEGCTDRTEWIFYQLCQVAKNVNSKELYYDIFKLLDLVKNNIAKSKYPVFLDDIIGNNASTLHGGLIEDAYSSGLIILAVKFFRYSELTILNDINNDYSIQTKYLNDIKENLKILKLALFFIK